MKHLLLLVVLLVSVSGLAARAPLGPQPQEKFLQGTWRLEGTDEKKNAWYLEWTFDMGTFKVEGYPPLHQEGSYQIIDVTGDKVTLELFDQKGTFGSEKTKIELILDKKKDTLMIKGQGPFKRNGEKS